MSFPDVLARADEARAALRAYWDSILGEST
jgi:hypothetical protein